VDGKEIALRALGRLQTPELLSDYLDFISSKVAVQDIHTGAIALSANPKTRSGLWRFFQDNFDLIFKRLAGNMVVFDRFVRVSLNKFSDRETEKEIAKFFEDKDNRGYDRSLRIVSDTILGRASYKERDAKVILEWLESNGYA
jgi:aminopeptidase N